MQDLDNNMDELLRKAADNYGLKPGPSSWDIIAPQLDYSSADTTVFKKENDLKKYLLTSLLALILLICGGIFNRQIAYQSHVITLQNIDKVNIENSYINKTNTLITESPNGKVQEKINPSINNERNISDDKGVTSNYTFNNTSDSAIQQKQALIQFASREQHIKKENTLATSKLSNGADTIDAHNVSAINKAKTLTVSDETKKNNEASETKKIALKKQTGFYTGLLAGVSINAVKYQGLRKPGFDIGLLAGYKYNKKVSFETGLLYTKKNYYSDGRYFSMNKVGGSMPQDMQIINLEGRSQLLEIPFRVKYNITQKKGNTLYAAGGLSSYILLNEKNNYLTLLNGTKQNMISTYPQSSGYFVASVHLGAGYEYKATNKINIRIEPYVQLPVKGIGVGSLRVMSAGLYTGFSFPLH